jgi:O-antigen/teichoic acid export membrane protein
LLAILLIVLFSLWFYLPKLEQSYKPGVIFDLPKLKELIPYGLGNHLATLLYQLPQLVFPLLILELLGATANGYAYIALMLGGFLTGPGLALANSAFAEGASDRGRSREILSRASLLGVLSTTILAAVVIFGAEWLLFLFGLDDASESVKLLRWLALASPIIVFNQLYFTYLRLEDRVPGLVALSSIMAIVTVVISIIFMPKIGIVACGIGIMVGNALLAILVGCRLSLKSPMDKGKSRRHLPRSNSMS